MSVIIETTRLLIRRFRPCEEDAYLSLMCDEQVKVHLPKRTADEIRKGFRDTIAADEAGAAYSKWAIVNKADDDLVGMGLLRLYENNPEILEVGYSLHVKYWGQGLATELTKALIAYARKHPEIKAIAGVTTLANIPSQIVLQKAGLIRADNFIRDGEELAFFKLML